jgi:hypothetical protein
MYVSAPKTELVTLWDLPIWNSFVYLLISKARQKPWLSLAVVHWMHGNQLRSGESG